MDDKYVQTEPPGGPAGDVHDGRGGGVGHIISLGHTVPDNYEWWKWREQEEHLHHGQAGGGGEERADLVDTDWYIFF